MGGVVFVVVLLVLVVAARRRRRIEAHRAAVKGGDSLAALSLLSEWSVRRSRLPGRFQQKGTLVLVLVAVCSFFIIPPAFAALPDEMDGTDGTVDGWTKSSQVGQWGQREGTVTLSFTRPSDSGPTRYNEAYFDCATKSGNPAYGAPVKVSGTLSGTSGSVSIPFACESGGLAFVQLVCRNECVTDSGRSSAWNLDVWSGDYVDYWWFGGSDAGWVSLFEAGRATVAASGDVVGAAVSYLVDSLRSILTLTFGQLVGLLVVLFGLWLAYRVLQRCRIVWNR